MQSTTAPRTFAHKNTNRFEVTVHDLLFVDELHSAANTHNNLYTSVRSHVVRNQNSSKNSSRALHESTHERVGRSVSCARTNAVDRWPLLLTRTTPFFWLFVAHTNNERTNERMTKHVQRTSKRIVGGKMNRWRLRYCRYWWRRASASLPPTSTTVRAFATLPLPYPPCLLYTSPSPRDRG